MYDYSAEFSTNRWLFIILLLLLMLRQRELQCQLDLLLRGQTVQAPPCFLGLLLLLFSPPREREMLKGRDRKERDCRIAVVFLG